MWILTALKMLKVCDSGVKILALIAILALPSVFAYGNRPGDYQTGKWEASKNVKNGPAGQPRYSQFDFWTKLTPEFLNQARSPHIDCYQPSNGAGHLKNCQPHKSASFPSNEAICRCSKCEKVPVKLICFAGTWYVHPEIFDFPCDNCDALCPLQGNKQFTCEDNSVGTIGDIKIGCFCVDDCLEYDIECGSNGRWTQSSFIDDSGKSILCNAERKTVVRDDKEVNYHNGVITVRCKQGYKTSSPYAVSCRNGVRNGSIPECILDHSNNGGFGGFEQENTFGDFDPFNNGQNNHPNFNNNPNFNNPNLNGNKNPNFNFPNNNNPNSNNNPNFGGNNNPNSNFNPNNIFPNNNNPNSNNNPNFNGNTNPNKNPNSNFNPNIEFPFNNNNNPDFNQGGIEDSGLRPTTPVTRVPKFPENNASGLRPTSASVTSNKPKNRNFDYMYILFAVLALLAVLASVALVVTIWRCRHPAKISEEAGVVAADDGASNPGVKGSYSTKK
ncbi:Hypothetical predicted protein [Cloeon dipterum]|uniref:Sushi domain-containing protein n=1 Tax=Cloeon dipterum TaxID=197152 RepID=A0A8S1BXN9_9INSE|nr:Hypothetical predicted protein [Cloeon dipterum]